MKGKDPGPMEGYQDWKIENVPVDLTRRLKAAIGAKGLSERGWWMEAAERTAAAVGPEGFSRRAEKEGDPIRGWLSGKATSVSVCHGARCDQHECSAHYCL